ncbi:MAG: matrixin family metalloprotease [Fimbriimonadales bacterium]
MKRNYPAWLLGLILLAGCGGTGTETASEPLCSPDTFTPNYVRQLERLLYWERFPLRVYFVRDANYSPFWESIALEGFNQWVEATGNKVQYQVVTQREGAQIVVKFDPTTRNGLTTYTYYPSTGRLVEAEVSIGTQGNRAVDIRSVSAHEFGHALGIGGHSPFAEDMMYATFVSNIPLLIQARDLNTLKVAYCDLFLGRSRSVPPDEEPTVQWTISCCCSEK